jgi:hypothetical protein
MNNAAGIPWPDTSRRKGRCRVGEECVEEIATDVGCGIHRASDLDISALGKGDPDGIMLV